MFGGFISVNAPIMVGETRSIPWGETLPEGVPKVKTPALDFIGQNSVPQFSKGNLPPSRKPIKSLKWSRTLLFHRFESAKKWCWLDFQKIWA
jgi:hypothetical protein